MITMDGYYIQDYSCINRIVIGLPQTTETLINSAEPVSKRRAELEGVELAAILELVKTLYESNKED